MVGDGSCEFGKSGLAWYIRCLEIDRARLPTVLQRVGAQHNTTLSSTQAAPRLRSISALCSRHARRVLLGKGAGRRAVTEYALAICLRDRDHRLRPVRSLSGNHGIRCKDVCQICPGARNSSCSAFLCQSGMFARIYHKLAGHAAQR